MIQVVAKLYSAFKNSWKGLKNAVCVHWAFQAELVLLLVAIPCAVMLARSVVEFILLVSSIMLLLIVELINSAIETTVNRISLDHHELSGLAKDLASAAVLLTGLNAALVWGIILIRSV